MKKYLPILLLFISYSALAQVGINTTGTAPAPAAMLDVSSTNKGVLVPRMSTVQKFAIVNPVEGLMVYDTDVKQFSYCLTPSTLGGTVLVNCNWVNFGNTPNNWYASGSDIYNTNAGNVGIGSYPPTAKLDIAGNIKIADGTQGAGKLLTSDASGLASWQTASTSPSAVGIGFDGLLFQYFIASNTPSYLRWGNKLYEFNGSNYNPTTGEYTISKNGFYMIHVAIGTTRDKDNISIYEPTLSLEVNGNVVSTNSFSRDSYPSRNPNDSDVNNLNNLEITFMNNLSVNDVIKVKLSVSQNSQGQLKTDNYYTAKANRFFVNLIR